MDQPVICSWTVIPTWDGVLHFVRATLISFCQCSCQGVNCFQVKYWTHFRKSECTHILEPWVLYTHDWLSMSVEVIWIPGRYFKISSLSLFYLPHHFSDALYKLIPTQRCNEDSKLNSTQPFDSYIIYFDLMEQPVLWNILLRCYEPM